MLQVFFECFVLQVLFAHFSSIVQIFIWASFKYCSTIVPDFSSIFQSLLKYTWDQNMYQEKKKLTMVNFLIFVQKNVSTIRFQEIKIRPFGDFEKMRFLCFYIIKSMARKGYFGPKSDFRGSKIPPRGASST